MINQHKKPFFYSTLGVSIAPTLFAVFSMLTPEDKCAYPIWWAIATPILCTLMAVIVAVCYVSLFKTRNKNYNLPSTWNTFYKFYSLCIIPIVLIVELTIIYYLSGSPFTIYNFFIPLFLWFICLFFTFLLAWLLYLLFMTILRKKIILSVLMVLLMLATMVITFCITFCITFFTIYVSMIGEAYRNYPKTEYQNNYEDSGINE